MSRKRKFEVFEDVLGQGSPAAVLREAARTIRSYLRALGARLTRARNRGVQHPRFAYSPLSAVPRYVWLPTVNQWSLLAIPRSDANAMR